MKRAALFVICMLSVLALAGAAQADGTSNECGILGLGNGLAACPSPAVLHGNSIPFNSESGFVGARSDPGSAPYPIFAFDKCRYVDNISSPPESLFVPFNAQNEWLAFINRFTSAPDFISLTTCAVPYTPTLYPNSQCNSPVPASQNVNNLGYARTGTISPAQTASFQCTVYGLCDINGCGADQTWTQTATATYIALNADVDSPSWSPHSLVYTGIPPAPNPAPSPSCTPDSQTQTLPCPAGDNSGTHVQQRDYTCPAATWGAWYNTTNTCEPTHHSACGPYNGTCLGNAYEGMWVPYLMCGTGNTASAPTLTGNCTSFDPLCSGGAFGMGCTYTWTCTGTGGSSAVACWANIDR